jgi:hypothetical protein
MPSESAPGAKHTASASRLALCLLLIACQPAQTVGPGRSAASAKPLAPEAAATEACASELVTVEAVRGVIFDAACAPAVARSVRNRADDTVIGYFRPTVAQIRALEVHLLPALELGRSKPETLSRMPAGAEDRAEWSWGASGAIAEILQHFAEYRRQYVGIVVQGGARRVFVNCFLEGQVDGRDDFPSWKVRLIDYVDDGGAEFWSIEYDVASGRFLGFNINPSA